MHTEKKDSNKENISGVTFCCDIFHRYDKVGRLEIVGGELIKNEVYTDNLLYHPCPNSKTMISVAGALQQRVICEERVDEQMLQAMHLKEYNMYDILRYTHGVDVDDFIWFRFDGEDIVWDDVRVR